MVTGEFMKHYLTTFLFIFTVVMICRPSPVMSDIQETYDDLKLYSRTSCPFSVRVLDVIEEYGFDIEILLLAQKYSYFTYLT